MYNGKNDNDNNNSNSLMAFAIIISIYWQCIMIKMIMIIIKYITN